MTFKIFIDTEFTDFIDPQLISIGMAAESGETFYAELPYDRARCSQFVRDVVIPLLENTPESLASPDDLYIQISNWLRIVRPSNESIDICFDYQTDWDLFSRAFDHHVPSWCNSRLIGSNINELLRYEFHKKNQLPEHHALNDARANCYAFREHPSLS
jgi:hypothetical protein